MPKLSIQHKTLRYTIFLVLIFENIVDPTSEPNTKPAYTADPNNPNYNYKI